MANQTITQYINSLTPSTLSVRGTPYKQSTIDKYKRVVENAFISQNVDIDTINWDDTDTTSKLIDKITPTSYIAPLLGILVVWKSDLLYYSSMAEQYRAKIAEQPKKQFNQNIEGLEERINTIPDVLYRLLFLINLKNASLRPQDYFTIKINHFNRKTDNYLSPTGKLVFNNAVKNSIKRKIEFQLQPELVKICKKLIPRLKKERDTLFSGNLNIYHKATSKYSKLIGLEGGFHNFRRVTYQTEENKADLEASERIQEVARLQNHSLEIAKSHYS